MNYRLFVKTSAEGTKYSVLGFLLLIYFVIYATSPLSYTFAAGKVAEKVCTANGKTALGNNFNIFLLELVCARIDAKKNTDLPNSGLRVLIRKARATLPENAASMFAPLGVLTSFAYISSFPYNSSSRLPAYSSGQRPVCQGATQHSGLSPPA
jgi:hypothetical protein